MRLSVLAAAGLVCISVAARADGTGSSVTGALYFNGGTINYFNPSYGFVPTGYKNTAGTTVTIGSGVEFGFKDGANLDTADFTGTTLAVSDVDSIAASPFEMTFTDTAFTGFSETSGVADGYTFSFSGDTLDVFYDGSSTAGTFTGNFTYATTAATPEPSSFALLGTGVLGAAGVLRRRFA